MKWLIASDIHGSAFYCRKLMEAYEKEQASRMLLLGDLLYHGPRNDLPREYAPKEVISLLNGRASEILAVRGNCEAEVDQMVLDFPVMADYMVLSEEGLVIYCTHGHIWNAQNLPPLKQGDVLLHGHTHMGRLSLYDKAKAEQCDVVCSGHTHVASVEEYDGVLLINPGSLSRPRSAKGPSCAVLTVTEESVDAELLYCNSEVSKSLPFRHTLLD